MLSHVEVDDPPPIMQQDQKTEKTRQVIVGTVKKSTEAEGVPRIVGGERRLGSFYATSLRVT